VPRRTPTVDEVWPPRAGGRESWETLCGEIRGCTLCHLHRGRLQAVVYRGSLRPKVFFVGEAPGKMEDRQGLPFVGAAGRILDRAIASLGLGEGDVGISNAIKCRPPDNAYDAVGAATCRPYLARQLAYLKPRVVVTLGAHALEAFRPDALPITRVAGAPLTWRETPLFPMVHPAAVYRSTSYRQRWEKDVGTFARLLPEWLERPAPR
jgi:uracil-DNA glycosylase family 4